MERCMKAALSRRENENARQPYQSDAQTAGKPRRAYHIEIARAVVAGAAIAALALTAMWSYGVAYDLGYERGCEYAQKAEL